MAKIAYLGPPYTHSHDLLLATHPTAEHIEKPDFPAVLDAVVSGECHSGVVPFWNSSKRNIESAQIELIKRSGRIFVSDVLPLYVRNFVCGFGTIPEIQELHTKDVVFEQTDDWIKRNCPKAKLVGTHQSTAAAVRFIAEHKPPNAAAIGARGACEAYEVPLLAGDVQRKPNITMFFAVSNVATDETQIDCALMCFPDLDEGGKEHVQSVIEDAHLEVGSNWPSEFVNSEVKTAYFVEITHRHSNLDLVSGIGRLKGDIQGALLMGGYRGKRITTLLNTAVKQSMQGAA